MLLQLCEYKACIEDVQRALDTGYPDNLVHKLHERRGKCCMKLKAYQEATKSFETAFEFGHKNIAKSDQFCKEINAQLLVCAGKSGSNITKEGAAALINVEKKAMPMLAGVNPQMPSFSKSVKIVHSKTKGRHGIATRKIECGEIILVEKTDFSFTALTFRGKVCTHCQQPSLGMIPSHLNTKVRIYCCYAHSLQFEYDILCFRQDMFCSQSCLEQALQTYHPKESLLLDIFQEAQLAQSEWHTALRSILKYPVSFLVDSISIQEEDKTYGSNLASDECYISNSLQSLLNLFTCELSWPVERLHFQAFVAYFYIKCLCKVGYFQSAPQDQLTHEEMMIAKLLTHIMNVSSTNAHEFGRFQSEGQPNLMEGSVYPVGGTLTPSMVLLNHSCDPNTIRYQNGKNTILMANRTIKEGDEARSTIFITLSSQI